MYRKYSDADYSSWVIFQNNMFDIIKGKEFINQYQVTSEFSKTFCLNCGSTICCVNNDKFPDHIYVARGNITSNFDAPIEIQVYPDSKTPWVDVCSNIPELNP